VEKGKKKVKRAFYARAVKLANPEHARTMAEQASEMWRRILRSFAAHPDGGELADGFVAVIEYFSGIGFWRGYRNAKRQYASMKAVKRTPDGRQEVHRAIQEILEKDIDMPAEEICKQLDEMKLSASFDLRIAGKQKTVHIGPKHKFCWASVCREWSVKRMISRLRTRARSERNAKAWMKLSGQVFQDTESSGRNGPNSPTPSDSG
jgi:hypothetical protein